MTTPLPSERVVIESPMSFAGSTKRLMPATRRTADAAKRKWEGPAGALAHATVWLLGVSLLLNWWAVICIWYLCFGLLLIPYRLLRRGQRRNHRTDLQHREMLAAIQAKNDESPAHPQG